jgi:hypothetical protein
MVEEVISKVESLEAQLQSEPDSPSLREQLLWVYFEDQTLHGHLRRIEHILWYVRNFPRKVVCRSPLVKVNPAISSEGYRAVQKEWLRLLTENSSDPEITRGAALFINASDNARAVELLRSVIDKDPNQAEVWMELGRISSDPADRLSYLKEARRRGSKQPNLLVWIARTAVEVDDIMTAETVGFELLALVDAARAEYGDKLDWKEKGKSLWEKALKATGDKSAASQLVSAISDHAYRKHWGHTVLGHVALKQGVLRTAIDHLRESGAVVGDHRLSSYGPSFTLAKELCIEGAWSEVEAYLRACEWFWKDDRLKVWLDQVECRELPDFIGS